MGRSAGPVVAALAVATVAALLVARGAEAGGAEAAAGADGRPDLLGFGSVWRMQLTGETVPDGDEWCVSLDGVGWLHQFFWADDNPTRGRWVPRRTPLAGGGGTAGVSIAVYARREVRVTTRDFSSVEMTLRTHPSVGAIVYVNGAIVHQTNLVLPLILGNDTTSPSRGGAAETRAAIDGRHFGARGVVVVAVELHGPAGNPPIEPAAGFDMRMMAVGHLPPGAIGLTTAPKLRSREQADVALGKVASNVAALPKLGRARARRSTSAVSVPFAMGSEWRYSADGSDHGTVWRAIGFDDSGWATGVGHFGFGDGDEVTAFADTSRSTYYFRKTFALSSVQTLRARLVFDDGVIVWVNGHDVFRSNMAFDRPVVYTDWATSSSSDNEAGSAVVDQAHLVVGVNVVAVEVHNRSPTSSDVSFDLALAPAARPTSPPSPPLGATPLPLTFGSAWRFTDDGSDQGTGWRATAFDDSAWPVANAEFGWGDSDEATVLWAQWAATFYFRKSFTLETPKTLLGDLIVDDGAVVFVNGREVLRSRVGSGAVAFDDFAASTSDDNEEVTFEVDPADLVPGTNWIAVEVHNADGSSDVSFDLALVVKPHDPALVAAGDAWRYHDGVSGAAPPGWAAPGFDDAAWPLGRAPLGYSSDEATTLSFGADEDNKPVTAYFRRTLGDYALAAPDGTPLRSCVSTFVGSVTVDDGTVVYVNGAEVLRLNLPNGAVTASTRASSAVSGSSEGTAHRFNVSAELLPDGTVTVAAEVHQASSTSSDLHFAMTLHPDMCDCAAHMPATFSVARPPYLQQLYSTSVIVRWDSATVALASVVFGTAPGALHRRADGVCTAGVMHKHSVRLTALLPDTAYYYALVGDVDGTVYSFKTQPSHSDIASFTAWFLGDAGTQDDHQRAVRDAFAAAHPGGADVMILGGDNAYNDGKEMEYEVAVFQMYELFLQATGVWSTLGNHDARSADSDTVSGVHFDSFEFPRAGEGNRPGAGAPSGTEAYYSFDHGVAHFVCLDSEDSDKAADGPMATWLAADIALAKEAGQQWLVAFWHHPPYSKGSHDSDTESSLVAMREVFVPILETGGLDVALSGHSHAYERSRLMDGHHGHSSTFSASAHVVQPGGGGEDSPYTKPAGLEPHGGAVFVVSGSAGKVSSSGGLNHASTHVSHRTHGSLVLEFSQTADSNVLDAKFVTAAGAVADRFRITKPHPEPAPRQACVQYRGRRVLGESDADTARTCGV